MERVRTVRRAWGWLSGVTLLVSLGLPGCLGPGLEPPGEGNTAGAKFDPVPRQAMDSGFGSATGGSGGAGAATDAAGAAGSEMEPPFVNTEDDAGVDDAGVTH